MSSPMTPERLAEITARVEATTKGPWGWHEYGRSGRTLSTPGPVFGEWATHELNVLKTTDDWPPHDTDAEFIAHARADVPDLLAEVERLRGSLADMLEISREMQANVRASVTLAYLQEEIVDILHPMPEESA